MARCEFYRGQMGISHLAGSGECPSGPSGFRVHLVATRLIVCYLMYRIESLARWPCWPDGPDGGCGQMGLMESVSRWRGMARWARWEPGSRWARWDWAGQMDAISRWARWSSFPDGPNGQMGHCISRDEVRCLHISYCNRFAQSGGAHNYKSC